MKRGSSGDAGTGSPPEPAQATQRRSRASGDGARPRHVDQGERFLNAARALGDGVSPEHFAELVGAIAKARLPKANGTQPKKPKSAKSKSTKPKLIPLKSGR